MAKVGINKKKVLFAAVEMIDEQGIEVLTCKALSDKLGIKLPSLYNHVKGLEGLLNDLSLHGLYSLKNELIDASIGKSGEDAILSILNAYYGFAIAHPGLYNAIRWNNNNNDEMTDKAIESILMIFKKVLGAEFFNNEQSVNMFRMIRAMVHGFSVFRTHDRLDGVCTVNDSFEYGARILVREIKM